MLPTTLLGMRQPTMRFWSSVFSRINCMVLCSPEELMTASTVPQTERTEPDSTWYVRVRKPISQLSPLADF